MTKALLGMLLVMFAILIAGYAVFNKTSQQQTTAEFNNENGEETPVLGGDRDEHGCIGSAGYSWCEEKQKCLRIWEEYCPQTEDVQAIRNLLAEKYDKTADEIYITVSKGDESHMSGGVKFSPDKNTEGGSFLAAKINGEWQVVYDGNGSVDCQLLRTEYSFPDDILVPQYCD